MHHRLAAAQSFHFLRRDQQWGVVSTRTLFLCWTGSWPLSNTLRINSISSSFKSPDNFCESIHSYSMNSVGMIVMKSTSKVAMFTRNTSSLVTLFTALKWMSTGLELQTDRVSWPNILISEIYQVTGGRCPGPSDCANNLVNYCLPLAITGSRLHGIWSNLRSDDEPGHSSVFDKSQCWRCCLSVMLSDDEIVLTDGSKEWVWGCESVSLSLSLY